MIFAYGKHKGRNVQDVPREYIDWLIEQKERELRVFKAELARREHAEEATLPMMERLALSGYRKLAKECHPDHGGTHEQMLELNASYEKVKTLLRK